MSNNMQNDIVMLLVELQSMNLPEARAAMVETLDLLADEVNSALLAIKSQAHVFLDDGDIEGVKKCMQLSNSIGSLSGTISSLKDETTYNTQSDNKPISTSTNTFNKSVKPLAFTLNKQKYHLTRQTWRQLFYQVLCALSELNKERFEEYVKVLNERNVTYYQFSADSDSLLSDVYKNKPLRIPCANLYVRLTGDASVMRRSVYEAVTFFHMETSFNIETSNNDTSNIINIVDDDDEE